MDEYEPLISLALALAAGALIGVQRERVEGPEDGTEHARVAGVRTHALVAIFGALSALLARSFGAWLPAAGLLGMTTLIALAYGDDLRRSGDRGMTSEVALLLTFVIGALAGARDVIEPPTYKPVVVAALAVLTTWLLSAKRPLHEAVARLSEDDLYAFLRFLAFAAILLPLSPNEGYGPYGALNPFQVMLMVVLVAGLGFVGYIAMRWFGAGRGVALTGLLGGLVSSTAVTLAFSHEARQNQTLRRACMLAILLASTIMIVRVFVEVAIVYRPLLEWVVLPLGAMTVAGLIVSGVLYVKARNEDSQQGQSLDVENPVELGTAIKFGLLFGVVLLVSKAAQSEFGSAGLYVTSVLAGLTDMDAITLSVASLARNDGLSHASATVAIVLAAASNTVVKAGLAFVLGGVRFGLNVALGFALVLACGALGLLPLFS